MKEKKVECAIEYAIVSLAGDTHGNKNGDSAKCLSLVDGRFAFILSDGMGKGEAAAKQSKAVLSGLLKLLKKGVAPARAIKIINKQSTGKKTGIEDSFATVDLFLIDKGCREARFYKMGAAKSYVIRSGNARKIEHAALPVGIVPKVSARQLKLKLRLGDTIIMLSDGVTEAHREDLSASWLETYLEAIGKEEFSAEELARKILSLADLKYESREKDDLTAIVIKLKK